MIFIVPDWKWFKINNIMVSFEGRFNFKKHLRPEIQISDRNENSGVHINLSFESVDELKRFLKKIEDTIPLLEEEQKQRWEEHFELNPELRGK